MRFSIIAFTFLATMSSACAEPAPSEPLSVTEALDRSVMVAARKSKAGALLDVRGCGLSYLRAEGVANRKTKLAMPTNEQLRIASVGKLYTAAVIHQLVQAGKLDLEKPGTYYLKDGEIDGVPNGHATLRQMLNHTSGVPDYYDAKSYLSWDWEKPIETERVLTVARRRKAKNEPGATYAYSNTNYHILALVAEKVTETSLSDLIQTQLLDPLNLMDTRYNTAHPEGTVHGYGTELRSRADTWKYAENTGPDSGITATSENLSSYLSALFLEDGALISIGDAMLHNPVEKDSLRQLSGPGAEIIVGKTSGLQLIGHTGDTFGYLTFAFAIPDYNATVIGHINSSKEKAFVEFLQSSIKAVRQACTDPQ